MPRYFELLIFFMQNSIGEYNADFKLKTNDAVEVSLAYKDAVIASADIKYVTDTTGKRCIEVLDVWVSKTSVIARDYGILESGRKLGLFLIRYATQRSIRDIIAPDNLRRLIDGYRDPSSQVRIH